MHNSIFGSTPPTRALPVQNLQIDAQRLWDSLMETAQIGATPKGGVCRLTLTDLDRQVRDWFKTQCEALGCRVGIDDVGNMFARRPGKNPALAPIAMGSHLDTQPTGGKFDGALGVLAALEALRTLHDLGYETNAPIEIVNWTNEEGSRFAPELIDCVRIGAEKSGFAARDMISGAGHDAAYVARVAPTTMIFVPCRGGISHNEAESTSFDECAAGAQVLLNAVLEFDRRLG
jgi:acetylornithine deacetylase/succinyl-diaminopimelate desuccinylase-like protein